LSFKGLSSFSIFRGKALAVSAPGGVELNENILIRRNYSIEIGLGKNQNSIFFRNFLTIGLTEQSNSDEQSKESL